MTDGELAAALRERAETAWNAAQGQSGEAERQLLCRRDTLLRGALELDPRAGEQR